jgi:RNA polymerase sigma-70 factor (ECF subfamily)
LHKIAKNRALDEIKRAEHRRTEPLPEETELASFGDSDISFENSVILRQHFEEAMSRLLPRYQRILILRYYFRYSFDEIAEALNITPGNARKRHKRAIRALEAILDAMEDSESPDRTSS